MIALYIINIFLFLTIGVLEGFLWHYSVNKISKHTARNLHIPLLAIRFFWFGYVFFSTNHDGSSTLMLLLCHPFWHLGAMYQVRHWLNDRIYKFGFFDMASESSTSILDTIFPQPFFIRLVLLLFGTTFYFLWNYWL